MAQTISVLALSEDETIETAINNAISAIQDTLCERTGHYEVKAARPKDHPELYIGAHAQTDRGQELLDEVMQQTSTALHTRLSEMQELFENNTIDELEYNGNLHQLCSSIGDTQSLMYQLFDATGHHTGHAITDETTVEHIIENNRLPVYIVQLLLK